MSEEAVRSALAAWALPGPAALEPIHGGMNSHTWRVDVKAERFVAKLSWDTSTFTAGLEVAEVLESSGFPAGGPIRTRAGELSVAVGAQALALLRFVDGEP